MRRRQRRGLVLVGAGGLAREAMALPQLRATSPVVLDDDQVRWGTMCGRCRVVGAIDRIQQLRDCSVLLTIGKGVHRRQLAGRLQALGVADERYDAWVHPSVSVPDSVEVGGGSLLLSGVALTADAVLGRHAVLMPNVTVTHDCHVQDYATLAAGVSLGGGVRIGAGAYLGMNASVREGVVVGAGATLGMGSVLLEDLPPGETWVGVPARPVAATAEVAP